MRQEIYFPSCNFTAANPEAAKRIRTYLEQKMPVAGCCRVEKREFGPELTGVYFCQACREMMETGENYRLTPENLFVYLARDEDFLWPNYSGLTVNIQDCWRDREHPEIFDAVRTALKKMRVTVVEIAESREKAVFCGDLHFEPKKPENIELLTQYPGISLSKLPSEVKQDLMREQVEKFTCSTVVCYCNRCVKGVTAGGGNAVHLLELAMNTYC